MWNDQRSRLGEIVRRIFCAMHHIENATDDGELARQHGSPTPPKLVDMLLTPGSRGIILEM
ncbi:bsl3786 [Bradyrhizobium diazoefficiens USDA 110]|uniref:Bsl3786 protein n=1 Tax=Bradyrhizobium diazoefficiens (strain JCM 10833 / BCRC 13528 / IAM 13628 / NBRC 14792 / USDA 110) TaxID=224911 RepID=Q89NQ2_BRADU|nr:hypothetical protein CO678_18735 [Bradyrhizobium diazoefficiens]QBP22558.1 hypothetical protein Bdiaspc4_19555 [Bradyrhizobium diazoefficiens]QHP71159.1 hypothetical protein EI171_30015 [Bradyrhizobium sp. LCT2]BAC49051.1 bsl3786 [Bradyrhizobium diazoefficiens USDA 110]